MTDQQRQKQAMEKLGFTPEEIADVFDSDKKIDRGERLFELEKDLQAGAKKARRADRKPTSYEFTKRERKPNESKREIIAVLADTVRDIADNNEVNITNIEREFLFTANGIKYKIVLSAPRT